MLIQTNMSMELSMLNSHSVDVPAIAWEYGEFGVGKNL
jgi:uncharacterized protein YjeT (DUF2065 family)